METKQNTQNKTESSSTKQKKRNRRTFTAQQKCTAVLEMWTGNISQAQLCRDLKVSAVMLDNWQKKAMLAMVNALTQKKAKNHQTNSLSPKLQQLLNKCSENDGK